MSLATDLAALQTLAANWSARAVDSRGLPVDADNPSATKWNLFQLVERVVSDSPDMPTRVARRSAMFDALRDTAGAGGLVAFDRQAGRRAADVAALVTRTIATVGVGVAVTPKKGGP